MSFCPLVHGKGEGLGFILSKMQEERLGLILSSLKWLGHHSRRMSRLACVCYFFRISTLSQALYLALDFGTSERQDY